MQTKKILLCVAVVLFAFVFVAGCAGTKSKTQSEKDAARDDVRTMTAQSLAQLYKNEPAAKGAVADAAGYAVFSDFGFKVMFLGGAKGKGIAVNNATKQEIFMKMLEL
jgi:outer membrane murein-binding lipoprotein Lpp